MLQRLWKTLRLHGAWLLAGVFIGYLIGAATLTESQPKERWRVYRLATYSPKSQTVFYEESKGKLKAANFLLTRLLMDTQGDEAVLQVINKLPFDVRVNELQLYYYQQRENLFSPMERVKCSSPDCTLPADMETDLRLPVSHPERFAAYVVDINIVDCSADGWIMNRVKLDGRSYFVFTQSGMPLEEQIEQIRSLGY